MEQNSISHNFILIKDMNPMNRNIDCEAIVLQRESEPTRTRDGDTISRFIVADKTGSMILSIWGEHGLDVQSGDILRLIGVDVKLRMGQIYISTAKHSKVKRVGQDTFPFIEKPNFSENEYNNNNWSKNQPANNSDNRAIRGYMNNTATNNNNYPYNRNRSQHQNNNNSKGGFNNRARNNNNNNNNNNGNFNNRFHYDLDNPTV